MPQHKITRRRLAGALAATAGAVSAQNRPQPAQEGRPKTDPELAAALARVRRRGRSLRRFEIPIETEPAFTFQP